MSSSFSGRVAFFDYVVIIRRCIDGRHRFLSSFSGLQFAVPIVQFAVPAVEFAVSTVQFAVPTV